MDGIIAITISPGLTRQGILGMGVQLAFFCFCQPLSLEMVQNSWDFKPLISVGLRILELLELLVDLC